VIVSARPRVEIHLSPSKNVPIDLLLSKIMRVVGNPTRRSAYSQSSPRNQSPSHPSSTCLWLVPWQPNTLRQVLFFKSKANAIMARIGQFVQSRDHAKGEQNGGVCSHGNASIPLLYLIQGRPTYTGPFGHECGRNPPTQACGADIASQLPEGPSYGNRHRS
jgi:hypothetical protein